MSRKLIICLLASMVMRSPLLLKMRHISFLMFSVFLGEALVMASPWSRRSPTFILRSLMSGRPRNRSVGMNLQFIWFFLCTIYIYSALLLCIEHCFMEIKFCNYILDHSSGLLEFTQASLDAAPPPRFQTTAMASKFSQINLYSSKL